MIIAAHPDDAEIGMGGTIAALVKAKKKLVLVDLSDGEPTPFGTPSIRARESAQAAKILGLKTRLNLNMKNRAIFDSLENRNILASVIREYRPNILFLPYGQDAHPDHIQASKLGLAARFYSKFVKSSLPFLPHYPRKVFYYFCTHMRIRFQPAFLFNISGQIDQKMRAILAYKSQFAKNPLNRSFIPKIRQENAYWGTQIGCEFAEPFACDENVAFQSVEALLNA